jgi:hypothetical protein
MHLSKAEILELVRERGMAASEISLSTEGEYSPEDADWNYRDLLHMNHVHGNLHYQVFAADKTVAGSLWFEKILGLTFPAALVSYKRDALSHHALTVWGFFLLLSECQFKALSAKRTRVTTNYLIASPRWCKIFIPLIKLF